MTPRANYRLGVGLVVANALLAIGNAILGGWRWWLFAVNVACLAAAVYGVRYFRRFL